jgi:hypothetical protein
LTIFAALAAILLNLFLHPDLIYIDLIYTVLGVPFFRKSIKKVGLYAASPRSPESLQESCGLSTTIPHAF